MPSSVDVTVVAPLAWTPRKLMQVLSLDHHAHATRPQVGVGPVGHLLCEAFLDLGAASEELDHPGQFGQAEDAIAGQVADVHDADEWPRRCPTW
jgi:hypothetical protein